MQVPAEAALMHDYALLLQAEGAYSPAHGRSIPSASGERRQPLLGSASSLAHLCSTSRLAVHLPLHGVPPGGPLDTHYAFPELVARVAGVLCTCRSRTSCSRGLASYMGQQSHTFRRLSTASRAIATVSPFTRRLSALQGLCQGARGTWLANAPPRRSRRYTQHDPGDASPRLCEVVATCYACHARLYESRANCLPASRTGTIRPLETVAARRLPALARPPVT
ncbi:uncharacterized protein B0H18DRAFT_481056 [Fomitopsis serialis]|uniref:uncharacterized protein n=1 Tax=Fomitopsis serialis TaxID=139415 RepID=UPI0020074DE8|nr:uncharacterized protein B0H18DRAFT_481056 [Neoantrodia serialis]KAH9910299.1 hypothetical protein B0H18DRAFT_481056 [Neoantrodia serialis]